MAKNNRVDHISVNIENPTCEVAQKFVRMRWDIEIFHREFKQTCGLGNCQARTSRSQRNPIGFSMLCWIELAKSRALSGTTLYQQNWGVIKEAISNRLKMELILLKAKLVY